MAIRPQRPDARIGKVLGNLQLVDQIGSGNNGSVYRARHLVLRSQFAVKLLRPELSNDKRRVERFRREAIACSRLRHQNIVYVSDFGHDDEVGLYLVMELIEGESLHQLIRRTWKAEKRGMTLSRVGQLGLQLCDGMAAAHALGVIHRDLKPANVLLTRDSSGAELAKVVDFGLAQVRFDEIEQDLTNPGMAVGTPAYMAPEQVTGKTDLIGPRTDVYALGLLIYCAICGRRPFKARSAVETMRLALRQRPPPLSHSRPELAHTRLENLVERMLEKAPELRPADMHQVRAELAQAMVELRQLRIPDAMDLEEELDASLSVPDSPALAEVLARLCEEGTELGELIAALPGIGGLPSEQAWQVLWSVIQDALIQSPPDHPDAEEARRMLLILVEAALGPSTGAEPESREVITSRLTGLVALLPAPRRSAVVGALRPLAPHPGMPDIFGFTRHLGQFSEALQLSEPPPAGVDYTSMSLGQKLRQDVTLELLKAFLQHRIPLPWEQNAPTTEAG